MLSGRTFFAKVRPFLFVEGNTCTFSWSILLKIVVLQKTYYNQKPI